MEKKAMGYTFDHANKVITLTKAYSKRANTPGTKEFRELAMFHKNYPDYTITLRTATITANKNTHDGLTIEMIEKIIACQTNSEELMREYQAFVAFWGKEVTDKKTGKTDIRAPYGKVKSWFLKKVPNYQDINFSQPAASHAEPADNNN